MPPYDARRTPNQNDFVGKARASAGSLIFLVLAPGVVAGFVPWWLTGWRMREPLPYWLPMRVAGFIVLTFGIVALLHAFACFVIEGLRTPPLSLSLSPRSCVGTRSRPCAVSSASSTRRTGAPYQPGGRAANPGPRTSLTAFDAGGQAAGGQLVPQAS